MCVGQKIPGKMGGEWDTAVYLSPNWVQCYVYSVTCALTCRENQGPWTAWLQVLLLILCPQIRSLNQELSSSQDQTQFPFIPYQWASVTANPQNYSNKSHAPTGAPGTRLPWYYRTCLPQPLLGHNVPKGNLCVALCGMQCPPPAGSTGD